MGNEARKLCPICELQKREELKDRIACFHYGVVMHSTYGARLVSLYCAEHRSDILAAAQVVAEMSIKIVAETDPRGTS